MTDKTFNLKDGTALKDLQELYDAITSMSDEEFTSYTTGDSNDFANWIADVFEEKHLATALQKVKTKKQTQDLLKRYLDKGHFVHEVIILGGGIAGMAAAIYASRKRMDYLIISPDMGGQMAVSGDIENYPGFPKITSDDFRKQFKEQMKVNDIEFVEEKVTEVKKLDDGHLSVVTEQGTYETESLLICTGARARPLNIPGEKEYANKGLTYCAICDGPLFKGKDIAIVGGGAAALEAADFMLRVANKIYLITINPEMMGHEYLIERITGQDKIEVLGNTKSVEVIGDKMLTGLKVSTNGKARTLDVQGVFVEIGRIPNTEFLKGVVEMDDQSRQKHDVIRRRNIRSRRLLRHTRIPILYFCRTSSNSTAKNSQMASSKKRIITC
jgi:thioredoxin reductase